MARITQKDIMNMIEGDMHRWAALMRSHDCSGKHLEVAERFMGGIVCDDFPVNVSGKDKLNVVLMMIFDAGFHAGLSAKDKNGETR